MGVDPKRQRPRRVALSATMAIVTMFVLALGAPPSAAASPSAWQRIETGSLVAIDAEDALYQATGSPHFFVHLRLVNVSAQSIGVDLRAPWQTAYPNQWGRSATPTRTVIDERRANVRPLDPAARAALVSALLLHAITAIPPHGSMDYYAEFNASGRSDVDASAGPFVIVSLGGELRATDGTHVEQLPLDRFPPVQPDLVVHAPFRWQIVPPGGRIVRR